MLLTISSYDVSASPAVHLTYKEYKRRDAAAVYLRKEFQLTPEAATATIDEAMQQGSDNHRTTCYKGTSLEYEELVVVNFVPEVKSTQPTFSYMKQSDMLKCPFAIMVPEHYNSDGSCKCSDPDHRAMMIAEWEYTEADFVGAGICLDGSDC